MTVLQNGRLSNFILSEKNDFMENKSIVLLDK